MMTRSLRRHRLTQSSQAARVAGLPNEAEQVLRDVAFALHLTRKVSQQMLEDSETPEPALALAASHDSF